MSWVTSIVGLIVAVSIDGASGAGLRLPRIITSSMVLQAERELSLTFQCEKLRLLAGVLIYCNLITHRK